MSVAEQLIAFEGGQPTTCAVRSPAPDAERSLDRRVARFQVTTLPGSEVYNPINRAPEYGVPIVMTVESMIRPVLLSAVEIGGGQTALLLMPCVHIVCAGM